ncbi:trypsin-like serine protease [Plasmodium gonderi]|uniref:Trypsin-like serine protease n=1 Tax=Plasmodium gonderi TaxID=77519 RepID=A0A1Y1JPS5_PLAGO|nr:trypsin-like serine protease [Plasmodium gonderi]GAW83475.1 trypsin-like serine protease [Plasmodium gonderi]
MTITYLCLIYCRTKYLWKHDSFLSTKLHVENCVHNFERNYDDMINGIKNKLKFKYGLCNVFLKVVPLSFCENVNKSNDRNSVKSGVASDIRSDDRCINPRDNFTESSSYLNKNIEHEEKCCSKLGTQLIFHYVKTYVKYVVNSLLYFFFFLYETFYRTFCILSKEYLEFSKEAYEYSAFISDNLLNSFVTIYKIYKQINSLDFPFTLDELSFLGSGFIFDKRGYVLTAAHNITNTDGTFVIKNEDNFYVASVLGLHRESDVCVMKINSEEQFSYIPLDSMKERLKLGDTVITYGQIQNFDKGTYSVGIVNQPRQTFSKFKNFNEQEKTCLYPFIQISNPINKGMSGSPLIDKDGNLVGMIQKKIDNYGLALPVNILKNVATHLQHEGTYKEPFLGIVLKENEQGITPVYKNSENGQKIQNVLANSPADVAGITRGDIILGINNKEIKNICEVHEILNSISDYIKKKEDLEYKPFKNISFNKLKTNLKNFLVINKKFNISDVKNVSFLGKFHIFEKIENYGVNEICIVGRSNVGKSTFLRNFIKYLINVKEHINIKVSKNSGCTRSINLYSFENAKKKKLFILTDMPGFGYAVGIGKKKMEFLKKNIEDYIFLRNQLCLFFILIDMSVDIQKIDISIVNAIKKTNIPFRIICTKSDKFSSNVEDRLQAIKNFYELETIPIHISKFSNHN